MRLSIENQALRDKILGALPKAQVRFHEDGNFDVNFRGLAVEVKKLRDGWRGVIDGDQSTTGNLRDTSFGALMDALRVRSVEMNQMAEMVAEELKDLGTVKFRTRSAAPAKKAKAATPAKRGPGRPKGSKNKPKAGGTKTAAVKKEAKRGPGRPKGSKNKKRGPGRPKGLTFPNGYKAKSAKSAKSAKAVKKVAKKRGPGRPKGLKFPNGYKTKKVAKAAKATKKTTRKVAKKAAVRKVAKKRGPGRPKGLKFPNGYKKRTPAAPAAVETPAPAPVVEAPAPVNTAAEAELNAITQS